MNFSICSRQNYRQGNIESNNTHLSLRFFYISAAFDGPRIGRIKGRNSDFKEHGVSTCYSNDRCV